MPKIVGANTDLHVARTSDVPQNHELKTWPEEFEALRLGYKTFDYRRNDRGGFQVGDTLTLREYFPAEGKYSGRFISARITYVLRGPKFDIPSGYAVLSIVVEHTHVSDWKDDHIERCSVCGEPLRDMTEKYEALCRACYGTGRG